MKKHLKWILASLVILSMLLGACGQPAEAPAAEEPVAEEAAAEEPEEAAAEEPAEEEIVTIKWLMLANHPVEDSGFLEEFYEAYPNIRVEMEGTTIAQLYEAIQVRVGGGASDPDVFMVNAPLTTGYGTRGLLLPLGDSLQMKKWLTFTPPL